MILPAIGITLAGAAVAWAGCEGIKAYNRWQENRGYENCVLHNEVVQEKGLDCSLMQRKKKGGVDERLSDDPLNDSNLEEISHPSARGRGHYKFKDKCTGEIIEYDEAKSGKPGHKGHDHYHRLNPYSKGVNDTYLNAEGKPVSDGSDPSHLYPPEWVWWE